MNAKNIVLEPIKALKLAPGEALILHSHTLTAQQKTDLTFSVREQLWACGLQNPFVIIEGKFELGKCIVVERKTAPANLVKYARYLENAKGPRAFVTIAEFNEDWSPVGPSVLKQLVESNMIKILGGNIHPFHAE